MSDFRPTLLVHFNSLDFKKNNFNYPNMEQLKMLQDLTKVGSFDLSQIRFQINEYCLLSVQFIFSNNTISSHFEHPNQAYSYSPKFDQSRRIASIGISKKRLMLGNMNSNNDAGLTDFVTDAGFGNVTCEFVVGLKLLDENGEDIFRVSAC